MGTWQTGQLSIGSRCFDLLCSGKCDLEEKEQKLIVEPATKIPNLMTINKDGKIVFSAPQPMCTVRVPKGHTGWIYVELVKTSPQTEVCEDYLCLGIRRQGENKIIGPLYSVTDHTSKYIGLADDEVMELVPMLSKTKLSEKYTETEAGEEANIVGLTIPANGVFDFGSVYRINMKYHGDILWVKKECNLENGVWYSCGHINRGPVNDKESQLLLIRWNDGQLASSSNGIDWEDAGSVYNANEETRAGWDAVPRYGNGIWCAINGKGQVRRSIDNAKTWQLSAQLSGIIGVYGFVFGMGMFTFISNQGVVYNSLDAVKWNQIKGGPAFWSDSYSRILGYGNGKWICNNTSDIYYSKNGEEWQPINSNLSSLVSLANWLSCTDYVNGNFYVTDGSRNKNPIFSSPNGKDWIKLTELKCNDRHSAITYFDNKLLLIGEKGDHCHFGLFYPNDMYDSL